MLRRGFLTLGKLRGVPVRIHWSTALGAFVFGGLQFVPAFWLAFVLLVLVHELGHAWVVQRLGHRAIAVEVTGFGGLCHWDPSRATPLQHALVAWGGVAAQFLLLVTTVAYLLIRGLPTSLWEAQVVSAFTTINLWVIALNLLPIPPLDGAHAWRLFPEMRRQGLTPWGALRRWAARSKWERQHAGQESKPRGGHTANRDRHSGGAEVEQRARQARAEMARLLEQVAKDARAARK